MPREVNIPKDGPIMVRVVVREDDNPDIIHHDRTGDHRYADFREWIEKTQHWAVRNGKSVTLYPAQTET